MNIDIRIEICKSFKKEMIMSSVDMLLRTEKRFKIIKKAMICSHKRELSFERPPVL